MHYSLARFGTTFATRPRGAEIRNDLLQAAAQAAPGEPITIDFAGVHLISYSFADEFIGRLLADRVPDDASEHLILLSHPNEDVLAAIEQCVRRRGLIVGLIAEGDTVRLVNAPPHLQETIDAACALGEFRTSELAPVLDLTVAACNNRLRALLDAGLISRVESIQRSGGREYIYRVADPRIPSRQSD